jgi:hypothetical protein
VASSLTLGGSLLGADARAAGVPIEQATEQQKAQAKEVFTKAKEAFAAKKYEEALKGFRAANDIVSSPNVRIMTAQALDALGRSDEAYNEAATAEADARAMAATNPKYTETADAARKLRDTLRAQVCLVTVKVPDSVPPGATLTVGGREIPQQAWATRIGVKAGTVTVVLSGHPPKEVNAQVGQEATVDFAEAAPPPPAQAPVEPPPAEESGGSGFAQTRPIVAGVTGGVGVAGFVLFGVFGGLAKSKYSDLDAQCPDKHCTPDLQDEADTGRTYQTVANVSLVVGIVGVAAGAGLLVWDILDKQPSSEGGDGTEGAPAAAKVRTQLFVGPGSLAVRGSF